MKQAFRYKGNKLPGFTYGQRYTGEVTQCDEFRRPTEIRFYHLNSPVIISGAMLALFEPIIGDTGNDGN